MSTPTLINLPPPPSNPETPSDLGPGTPGSGTTSLSALSTTAIKDGHQGHAPPHGHQHSGSSGSSTNTLDAERADRISRLAGLERVATARGHGGGPGHLAPGAALGQQPPGYFDGAAPHVKERSTVGSASATGSVGGRTTWASSSDVNEADKMSEDQDDGASSTGGFSDEGNASLVGFGEGATSTADGPVSVVGRGAAGRAAGVASPPAVAKGNAVAPYMQQQQQQQQQQQSQSQSQLPPQRQSGRGLSSLSGGVPSPLTPGATEMQDDARMQDTMAVEPDAPGRVPPSSYAGATGTETAERIVRERRLDEGERGQRQQRGLGEGGKGVRQYYSEDGQI